MAENRRFLFKCFPDLALGCFYHCYTYQLLLHHSVSAAVAVAVYKVVTAKWKRRWMGMMCRDCVLYSAILDGMDGKGFGIGLSWLTMRMRMRML